MNQCCTKDYNISVIKEYDPQPKNKNGSSKWFLFRWDDGKKGVRRLIKCDVCGSCFLVQEYQLNKFSSYREFVFADWYKVQSEQQADYWNRIYTGMQLENEKTPVRKLKCIKNII